MRRRKNVYTYLVLFFMAMTNILFTNCSSNKYLSQSSTQTGSQVATVAPPTPNDSASQTPNDQPITVPPVIVSPPVVIVPPSSGQVAVVMAQGHMGRTLFSCDGGVSWRNDQSDRDSARCWVDNDPNYVECDHTASSARSLVYGDGYFYSKYGWGAPGTIRRSSDGINWQVILQQSATVPIGDVGYANGSLSMSLDYGNTKTSRNQGSTWVDHLFNHDLDHPTVHTVGNKIINLSRTKGFVISLDGGLTWAPQINPFGTGISYRNNKQFSEGRGLLVTTYQSNTDALNTLYAAVSRDNGLTWTSRVIHQERYSQWQQLLFDGQYFITWSNNRIWKSTDGLNWMSEPMTQLSVTGSVHFDNNSRNFIMIKDQWGGYYQQQRAYHSRDGKSWTQVSANLFRGGHPIHRIIDGFLPQTSCGL